MCVHCGPPALCVVVDAAVAANPRHIECDRSHNGGSIIPDLTCVHVGEGRVSLAAQRP
ncbi:hypothetical protein Ga0080559_TMP3578 [Salipiger profundus]|uniref:Uncharacterized protein n=1 Tax=Salipiger profundus TaxID=1229727 RepID=A0A1U7D876_9RHOB|nr:hypothetical protein Ga0080559_TMP3578 [Salipiger profundus]